MIVSVGERWESFVDRIVKSGRYGSASEVVSEGLRLVEEREAKLEVLRQTLNASMAEPGSIGDEEIDAALAAQDRALAKEGF